MPKAVAPPRSLALTWLRQAAGWTREQLAAAVGVTVTQLRRLETGVQEPDHERLVDLADHMGLDRGDVDAALLAVAAVVRPEVPRRGEAEAKGATAPPPTESDVVAAGRSRGRRGKTQAHRKPAARIAEEGNRPAEDPTRFDERLARVTAARLGLAMAGLMSPRVLAVLQRRRTSAARRAAAQRWQELQPLGLDERQLVIKWLKDFQTWAVAERLADESVRVAATGLGVATDLARLAVRVAELAEVDAAFRGRLLGFTRAFVANGLRIESRLREADLEMEAAKRAWGDGVDPHGLLPGWRLLDLEASLRRDQRRFAEALEILDRARSAAPAAAQGRILVNKSCTLEQAGDIEGAVAALQAAEPLVKSRGTLRDQWVLRLNLTINLCHLGRIAVAWEQLPRLKQLAQGMGNALDLLKVEWLSGRLAARLGQKTEACRILERVRNDYSDAGEALAVAMVSLELSVLYLEEGRTHEVRMLAERLVWIFVAEGVEPEALMAAHLFHQSALQEAANVEEARRLLACFEKAAGLGATANN